MKTAEPPTDPFEASEWVRERRAELERLGWKGMEPVSAALLQALTECASELGEVTHSVHPYGYHWTSAVEDDCWTVQGAETTDDPMFIVRPFDNGGTASGERSARALARLLTIVYELTEPRTE